MLTHQRLEIMFYEADIPSQISERCILTDAIGYKQYPLPKPLELFLKDYLCKPVRIAGLEFAKF